MAEEYRSRIKEFRWVAADDLTADPRNYRRHPEGQAAAVRVLLRKVGLADVLLAREGPDGRLVLIDGHMRADLLRGSKVPVIVLDVDEREAGQLLVGLDGSGELAERDAGALAALTSSLAADLEGLESMVAYVVKAAEPADKPSIPREVSEAFPVEELPAPPQRTKRGEVWALGRHRLAVGNCQDRGLLEAASDGAVPGLVVMDPPYCSGGFTETGRARGTWGDMAGDRLSTRGWRALLSGAIAAAQPTTVYMFTDWRMWIGAFDLVEAAGLPVRSMIVWDKGAPGLGSLWRPQHEIVLFASRDDNERRKGVPARGNVISCARQDNRWHYTQKPVPVLAALLENDAAGPRGEAPVLDLFCGSGSIFLAAEQLGSQAVGVEIDTRWADACLARWTEAGGEPPRLVTTYRAAVDSAPQEVAEVDGKAEDGSFRDGAEKGGAV